MPLGKTSKRYGKWTLRLLARKVVELEIAESVSCETIRRTLKNRMNTKRGTPHWVIPAEADAEFTAPMEDVLNVYFRPADPKLPVLCMDE